MTAAAQARGETLALALRANVVRITADGQEAGEEWNGHGFGFAVGQRGSRLVIVTANHVVRKQGAGPGFRTTRVTVSFHGDQGRTHAADLLQVHDESYDLAVLEVALPAGVQWQRAALGSHEETRRGLAVWFVGRERDWYVPTAPGRVNDVTLDSRILVDNLNVMVGSSGGPLVSDGGIVGMLERHLPGDTTRAVSIELIRRAVQRWNLPWDLTPARSARTPDPEPTPVVRRPPPPSGAGGGSSAAPPGPATGRLCPTLAGGDADDELLVSGRGRTRRVQAGACLDLEPGSYRVEVESPDGECTAATVEVQPDRTRFVRVSCAPELSGRWSFDDGAYVVFVKTGGSQYRLVFHNPLGVAIALGAGRFQDGVLEYEGEGLGEGLMVGRFRGRGRMVGGNQLRGETYNSTWDTTSQFLLRR
jgi:hypothetical protein